MLGGEVGGPLSRLYILSIESDSLSASSPAWPVVCFPELLSLLHACRLLERDFRPLLEDEKLWGNVALWTEGNLGCTLLEVSLGENCCWTIVSVRGNRCWWWRRASWWNWFSFVGVEIGRELVEGGCLWKVDNILLVRWGEWITGGGERVVACNAGALTK